MKISTKGRYAVRLMIELAMVKEGDLATVKDISENQNISDKYLEQIISTLKKNHFVKSIRGAQGGYVLAVKPEECTAGMILRAVEGDMSPVSCLEDETNHCERSCKCTSLKLWMMIDDAVKNVIDNVTLADMVEWEKGNRD